MAKASISGTVFGDSDKSKSFTAADTISPGRTVKLLPANKIVTADNDGNYIFDNLDPGNYQITRDFPKGFKMANPTNQGGNTIDVTIAAGESKKVDIGSAYIDESLYSKKATISGTVFGDSDGNKVFSEGDSEGTQRVVHLNPGNISTTSDNHSHYRFENLDPGTYQITRDFPKGYKMANPTKDGTNIIIVTVAAGESKTVDIGSTVDKGTGSDVQVTPIPQPEKKEVWHGTIIETSQAEAAAKDCGFNLWRDWCSVNWNTGKINDSNDISNANAKVKRGWKVILTVTVDEAGNRNGNMASDFSTVADQLIKGNLDKSIIVQLVNEANLDDYWPKGNVLEATQKFAVPIAVKLKAAGYTVACPSITYGAIGPINQWVDQIMTNSPKGLWDYIDGHMYADLNQFKVTFPNWAALGKKYGTKVMSSEWSHKVGNPAFAKEVKDFYVVMDQCCDIHCNFSYTYGAKFNVMNTYCWRDGKTTEVHDAIKLILNNK